MKSESASVMKTTEVLIVRHIKESEMTNYVQPVQAQILETVRDVLIMQVSCPQKII